MVDVGVDPEGGTLGDGTTRQQQEQFNSHQTSPGGRRDGSRGLDPGQQSGRRGGSRVRDLEQHSGGSSGGNRTAPDPGPAGAEILGMNLVSCIQCMFPGVVIS